jgi:hypothetical protein
MKRDILQRAMRKAYKATVTCEVSGLIERRSIWRAKETRARNIVNGLDNQIAELAERLAAEKDGVK